jgi:hypothetical protein
MTTTRRARALLAGVSALALVGAVATGPASATGRTSLRIVPPTETILGRTYGQWSAASWRYAQDTPVHTGSEVTHPLLRTGDIDCSVGQRGAVWFIGESFTTPSGPIVRSCTIPEHTRLFVTVYSWVNDNSNCDGLPATKYSVDELRAVIRDFVSAATALSVTIDGDQVSAITSPSTAYRATSPVFRSHWPADNYLNYLYSPGCSFSAKTTRDVADGIYVMLDRLEPGSHTVAFTVDQGTTRLQDITYHLTVAG